MTLSDEQVERLEGHYRLMVSWNKRLNLTTVTQLPEAAVRHYCESLFLAAHLPAGIGTVMDVGSGPGFPGIPCAVLLPEVQVTLVESHQRKAVFLKEATRGWSNVRVRAVRAEDVSEAQDWIISRAVDPEDVLRLPYSRFALLIGATDAARIPGAVVTPLPWGKERVLATVSRETTL